MAILNAIGQFASMLPCNLDYECSMPGISDQLATLVHSKSQWTEFVPAGLFIFSGLYHGKKYKIWGYFLKSGK